MPTKTKIKIVDNTQLRAEIDELYEITNQVDLAKWSISIAKHILDSVGIDYNSVDDLVNGFHTNELWQLDKARIHDVRQASFKIHKLARECDDEIQKTALRVAGQAVGSGHMREHAMVASDYAIKTMGLLNNNHIEAITSERVWQLNELRRIRMGIQRIANGFLSYGVVGKWNQYCGVKCILYREVFYLLEGDQADGYIIHTVADELVDAALKEVDAKLYIENVAVSGFYREDGTGYKSYSLDSFPALEEKYKKLYEELKPYIYEK